MLVSRVPGVLEGVRGPMAREVPSKAWDERVAYVSQESDGLLIVVSVREDFLHDPFTPVSHRSNQQGGIVYGVGDGRRCCILAAAVSISHPLIVEDVGLTCQQHVARRVLPRPSYRCGPGVGLHGSRVGEAGSVVTE